ncbi:hypothetical protein M5689_017028 [Euphorbia peplus]|nr:hypothetical protein M5689_017028 [Euphorbia peplus]
MEKTTNPAFYFLSLILKFTSTDTTRNHTSPENQPDRRMGEMLNRTEPYTASMDRYPTEIKMLVKRKKQPINARQLHTEAAGPTGIIFH